MQVIVNTAAKADKIRITAVHRDNYRQKCKIKASVRFRRSNSSNVVGAKGRKKNTW
jgi:hypothetical protein